MGKYRITIDGTGPHHNADPSVVSADTEAAELVKELSEAGHTIESARFEVLGSQEHDLLPVTADLPDEPLPTDVAGQTV